LTTIASGRAVCGFFLWYDLSYKKIVGRNSMALFDTLQVTTELVSAGIERNQAESIAKSIAKVQGDTVTKDYLDLRLSELSANIKVDIANLKSDMNSLRTELRNDIHSLSKEINGIKLDSQFTKWTNRATLVVMSVIASALIKIAFFH
jgi:t-SNARE complex subunit (syntaxin)